MEDHRIRRVTVLGGGTAGWMAASYLGKALGPEVTITVLEAPSIPKIGVGEATVPNLHKTFFEFIGLAENEWMQACNASYKMGIRFINWRTGGMGEAKPREFRSGPDHSYHLFGLLSNHANLPLSHYWTAERLAGRTDEPFEYACYREPPIMDALLAPRHADGTRWTNYAWHFDASVHRLFWLPRAAHQQGDARAVPRHERPPAQ